MKKYQKFTKVLSVICIFALILTAFSGCKEKTAVFEYEAFGGKYIAEYYTEDMALASEHFTLIENAIKEAEAEFSLEGEDTPLSILNREKLNYVPDSLKAALEDSVIICTALGDIVDITMGLPLRLWGFGTENPGVPGSEELKAATDSHTLDNLVIARDSNKVTISEDMEIDMSPLSKGIALDRAYTAGKGGEIPYKLTLGNIVMAYGEGPLDGKWEVEIKNPLSAEKDSFGKIKVSFMGASGKVFVSTSDITENSFSEKGKTYHSYLSPETGLPASNTLASVTVVTEAGITADALSDAILINGFTERSLSYIESFNAEAVLIFTDGTYYVTEGLKDSLTLSDSAFTEHTEAPETELFW